MQKWVFKNRLLSWLFFGVIFFIFIGSTGATFWSGSLSEKKPTRDRLLSATLPTTLKTETPSTNVEENDHDQDQTLASQSEVVKSDVENEEKKLQLLKWRVSRLMHFQETKGWLFETREKTATGWIKTLDLRNDAQKVFWETSFHYPSTSGRYLDPKVHSWNYEHFVKILNDKSKQLSYAQMLADRNLKAEFDRYWSLSSETRIAIDRFIMQAEFSHRTYQIDIFWEQLRSGLVARFTMNLPFYLGKITVNNDFGTTQHLSVASLFFNRDKNFYQLPRFVQGQLWKLFATTRTSEEILTIVGQKRKQSLLAFWNEIKFFFVENKDFATAELFFKKLLRYLKARQLSQPILSTKLANSWINRFSLPSQKWSSNDWSSLEELFVMQLSKDRHYCDRHSDLTTQLQQWSPNLWKNWKNWTCFHQLGVRKLEFARKTTLLGEIADQKRYLHNNAASPFARLLKQTAQISFVEAFQLFQTWKEAQLKSLWSEVQNYLVNDYSGFGFQRILFANASFQVKHGPTPGKISITKTALEDVYYQIQALFREKAQSDWSLLSAQTKQQFQDLFHGGLTLDNLEKALEQATNTYASGWEKMQFFLQNSYYGFSFPLISDPKTAKSYALDQLFVHKNTTAWKQLPLLAQQQFEPIFIDGFDLEKHLNQMNSQRLDRFWEDIKPVLLTAEYPASFFSKRLLVKERLFLLSDLFSQRSNLSSGANLSLKAKLQLEVLSNYDITGNDLRVVLDKMLNLKALQTKLGLIQPILQQWKDFPFSKVVINQQSYSLENLFALKELDGLSEYLNALVLNSAGGLATEQTRSDYAPIAAIQTELSALLLTDVTAQQLQTALATKQNQHHQFWEQIKAFIGNKYRGFPFQQLKIGEKTYLVQYFFNHDYWQKSWTDLNQFVKRQIEKLLNNQVTSQSLISALTAANAQKLDTFWKEFQVILRTVNRREVGFKEVVIKKDDTNQLLAVDRLFNKEKRDQKVVDLDRETKAQLQSLVNLNVQLQTISDELLKLNLDQFWLDLRTFFNSASRLKTDVITIADKTYHLDQLFLHRQAETAGSLLPSAPKKQLLKLFDNDIAIKDLKPVLFVQKSKEKSPTKTSALTTGLVIGGGTLFIAGGGLTAFYVFSKFRS